MEDPVNFDNINLDGVLNDWLGAMREFGIEAIAVLGPNPFGSFEDRQVLCVQPPALGEAMFALARSGEFGAHWSDSDAPLVAWQHIAKGAGIGEPGWRGKTLRHGLQTMVRVEFPLPSGRAFECFMFSPREFRGRTEAALVVWSAMNVWPVIKRSLAMARSTLSPRERECLMLAFNGLTARETADELACTPRTVNYHIANAMAKLKVESKLAAIQRACWIGAI